MGNPPVMKHGVLENRPFSWMIYPTRDIRSLRAFFQPAMFEWQWVVILVAKNMVGNAMGGNSRFNTLSVS